MQQGVSADRCGCKKNLRLHMGLLTRFFIFTLALSWTCFIGVAFLPQASSVFSDFFKTAFLLLGTFAPSIIALLLTYKSGEWKALVDRIGKWNVNARWYLLAIFYMIVVKLLAAMIYRLIAGRWPEFGSEAWYIMIIAILFSTLVQAGEEVGWRGFALPRLTEKMGLPSASLLLGVVWAIWHLPLFFVGGVDKFGQSFPLFMVQVIALSVALSFLYWKTNGSLLLTMLMHAAVNNTKDIVPSAVKGASHPFALSSSLVAWLSATILWILAVYFLIQMRKVKKLE
jgi:membrane protease YdiL (CAAX protease family)